MYKNVIRVLIIFLIFLMSSIYFMSFECLAVDTKEITIKYLDESGNVIKEEEKKQIEMGNENVTKYVSSYKNIENGTNLFPAEISGYVIQLAKIKTYYDGVVREGMPDEISECGLIDNDRIAITSPKSEYLYIVEFIYKKDDNVGIIKDNDKDKENNNSLNNNINNNLSKNNTNTNNNSISNNTNQIEEKLPKAGVNSIIPVLVIISIIFSFICIIKYNIYKKY